MLNQKKNDKSPCYSFFFDKKQRERDLSPTIERKLSLKRGQVSLSHLERLKKAA